MSAFLMSVISFYRKYISGILPPACRFTPSCSEYMYEALRRYGAGKGFVMGFKRILRCNPFCKGGYDPVP
ncbi:MAG: membrane protein insertion efficiency factor YidD [Clostridiales bacterium]|nr:membrane protein insertion efficiency factor YidD [Clostridiales bacterium]